MRRSLLIVAALALMPASGQAQIICSEPLPPICTDLSLGADGALEQQQCASDVEDYQRDLASYVECLGAKLEAARAQEARMAEMMACLEDDACSLSDLGN